MIGRRGSKSFLAALLVWRLWNLLALGDPQRHYQIPANKRIGDPTTPVSPRRSFVSSTNHTDPARGRRLSRAYGAREFMRVNQGRTRATPKLAHTRRHRGHKLPGAAWVRDRDRPGPGKARASKSGSVGNVLKVVPHSRNTQPRHSLTHKAQIHLPASLTYDSLEPSVDRRLSNPMSALDPFRATDHKGERSHSRVIDSPRRATQTHPKPVPVGLVSKPRGSDFSSVR